MDIIWGTKAAASDAWAGTVLGALISPGHRRITHLLIRQGLVFRRRIAIPIDKAARSDADAVYFDMASSEMRAMRSEDVSDLSLSRRTRVEFHGGRRPHVKGIRISDEDGGLTHLVLSGLIGEDRLLLSLRGVGELDGDIVAINDDALEPDDLPSYRRDMDIKSDAWEALYASGYVSPTDLHGIEIAVAEGRAMLTGNVRARDAAEDIGVLLQNVDGILSVEDGIVSDRELEMGLTALLAKEHWDISERLLVHSQLGRIEISGPAPEDASMPAIMQLVRSMPGVREVEHKPATANAFPGVPEQEASEARPR